MSYFYRVFDLVLRSELECPTLVALPPQAQYDIEMTLGPVKMAPLDNPEKIKYMEACPQGMRVFFPEIMRSAVTEGSKIVIEPLTESWDQLRLFALGASMGALLHQRGYAVIHGNAIVHNDLSYVFAGPSGIGKSTLATAFHQAGFGLLADDVVAVRFDDQGAPWALPSYPHVKLWEDAIEALSLDSAEKSPLYDRVTKFSVPMTDAFYPKPCRLAGYYSLHKTPGKSLYLEPLKGFKAFTAIQENIFRDYYLAVMGLGPQHFTVGMALAKRVPAFNLYRPEEGFFTNRMVEAFQKGELV